MGGQRQALDGLVDALIRRLADDDDPLSPSQILMVEIRLSIMPLVRSATRAEVALHLVAKFMEDAGSANDAAACTALADDLREALLSWSE